jgi:hypothetical protein
MICGMWFTKLVGGICNKLRTYSMMNTMARVIILLCVIHLECWGQALSRLRISSAMERSLFSLAGGSLFVWHDIWYFFISNAVSFYILVSFVVCRWQRSGMYDMIVDDSYIFLLTKYFTSLQIMLSRMWDYTYCYILYNIINYNTIQ